MTVGEFLGGGGFNSSRNALFILHSKCLVFHFYALFRDEAVRDKTTIVFFVAIIVFSPRFNLFSCL